MASTPASKLTNRTILITAGDLARLTHMVDSAKRFHHDYGYIASLDQDLEAAQVVERPGLPDNVVGINSKVHVTDVESRKQMVLTVVFPRDANYSESRVSVLAPIGAALLGRRTGDIVQVKVPGGIRNLRITGIESGDVRDETIRTPA